MAVTTYAYTGTLVGGVRTVSLINFDVWILISPINSQLNSISKHNKQHQALLCLSLSHTDMCVLPLCWDLLCVCRSLVSSQPGFCVRMDTCFPGTSHWTTEEVQQPRIKATNESINCSKWTQYKLCEHWSLPNELWSLDNWVYIIRHQLSWYLRLQISRFKMFDVFLCKLQ